MKAETTFQRAKVREWIEEATDSALRVDDPLPDTLIARAEALGFSVDELKLCIYDLSPVDWSQERLAEWVRVRAAAEEETHG